MPATRKKTATHATATATAKDTAVSPSQAMQEHVEQSRQRVLNATLQQGPA